MGGLFPWQQLGDIFPPPHHHGVLHHRGCHRLLPLGDGDVPVIAGWRLSGVSGGTLAGGVGGGKKRQGGVGPPLVTLGVPSPVTPGVGGEGGRGVSGCFLAGLFRLTEGFRGGGWRGCGWGRGCAWGRGVGGGVWRGRVHGGGSPPPVPPPSL